MKIEAKSRLVAVTGAAYVQSIRDSIYDSQDDDAKIDVKKLKKLTPAVLLKFCTENKEGGQASQFGPNLYFDVSDDYAKFMTQRNTFNKTNTIDLSHIAPGSGSKSTTIQKFPDTKEGLAKANAAFMKAVKEYISSL